jgi:hypothetical protein
MKKLTRQSFHRAERRRRGLCVRCGKARHVRGLLDCAACALKVRSRQRANRGTDARRRRPGRLPLYSDAELRALAQGQKASAGRKPSRPAAVSRPRGAANGRSRRGARTRAR